MDDSLVEYKSDSMDGANEMSFAPIAWLGVGLSLILVFFSAFFYLNTDWPVDALGIVVTLAGAYFVFWIFTWSYVYRYLADRGWLWLRVPEMKAAFVEKDRGLYRIFVNVSGELQKHYRQLAAFKNHLAGYERMTVLHPQKQIVWIGLPWVSRLKTPWYEHRKDRDNPEKDPIRFLDLKERVYEYNGGEGEVIPDVDSADPIQIRARLVVSMRIFDPEKSLYSVEFFKQAVQNEIAARWRKAISDLSYFQIQPGTAELVDVNKLEINPGIQKQVHEKFCTKILKISRMENDEENNYIPSASFNEVTGNLIYSGDFPENSPAYDILHNWGVLILHLEVRDLDPADPDLRKEIEKKSMSRAIAAAALKEAEGKAAARIKEGEGERVYKEEVAKGIKAQARAEREGIAEGLKAIAQMVKEEGGNAALASDTAVRVASGTENMITEGGLSGFVGQLVKVADVIKSKKTTKSKKTEDSPPKT